MGKIKRETIKFLLPVDYKTVVDGTSLGRKIIPLYINPQSISTQDSKVIQETQTIGGYIVQFWGDKLTELRISGTTGSGGIEAIDILKSIYRNEQIQFSKILLDRQKILASDVSAAFEDLASASNATEGLIAAGDILFDDLISDTIDSFNETIEFIKDPISGITGSSDPVKVLAPTLASFVVSVDMEFQGQIHRGFFRNFSVTEETGNLGHFNYDFNFVILRTIGIRKNFMPWHRNPLDTDGKPRKSSSIYSPNSAGLSFPYNNQNSSYDIEKTATTISSDQSGIIDSAQRSLNRFNDRK